MTHVLWVGRMSLPLRRDGRKIVLAVALRMCGFVFWQLRRHELVVSGRLTVLLAISIALGGAPLHRRGGLLRVAARLRRAHPARSQRRLWQEETTICAHTNEQPLVSAYVVVVRGGTLAGHSIRRERLLVAGNDVAVLVDEWEDVGLVEQPVAVVTPQPAAGVGARTVRER